MNEQLARAHIEAQARLRSFAAAGVGAIWRQLGSWDEADVDRFLAQALPVVAATKRQSVSLTEAYLARQVKRAALGVSPRAIDRAVRGRTDPEEVYRRPFVTLWSKLGESKLFDDALAAAADRAESAAATDVQLAMTHTLREVGEADGQIAGYQRVPNGGACEFCILVSGQRYTTDQLMPIHNHCGCGVDVILTSERANFSGVPDNDPPGVAFHEHGELGPVLGSPAHDFTSEAIALG